MRIVVVGLLFALAIATLSIFPSNDSEAAWPGYNGKIAYEDNGIWVMDPDGSNREHLTTDIDVTPSWSPDGTKIAFAREGVSVSSEAPQGDPYNVWTMDADGGNQTELGPGREPSWSPDGTRIIYTLNGDIHEMDAADGDNDVTITGPDSALDYTPVYRPDGSKIAFRRFAGGYTDMWVADPDGTDLELIGPGTGFPGKPDWSPDGSEIVFRFGLDIWVSPYPAPDPNPIYSPIGDIILEDPSYSPDGSQIVFVRGEQQGNPFTAAVQPAGNYAYAIWTADSDGTNPQELPGNPGPGNKYNPDWQPLSSLPTPTPSPTPIPTPTPPVTPAPDHDTPTPTAAPTNTSGPTATPTETPAGPTPVMKGLVWGDDNCSEMAGPVDALLTLRHDAGLSVNVGDCPPLGTDIEVLSVGAAGVDADQVWGNVDCDTSIVSPIDALKILRYDAALSYSQTGACPPIGSDVSVQYAP